MTYMERDVVEVPLRDEKEHAGGADEGEGKGKVVPLPVRKGLVGSLSLVQHKHHRGLRHLG